jgi:CBS domain-containing protein
MSVPATPSPAVLAGLAGALARHTPFDRMDEADLDMLVRASVVRYFEAGELILGPGRERPAHCLVIREGAVRGGRETRAGLPATDFELAAGEMFPLAAILAGRGVTSHYRAARDTFVLAFPVAVFDALLERSPVFADFCRQALAHLLDLARRHYQSEYVASVTDLRGPGTLLRSIARQPPVGIAPDTALEPALRLMEEERIGSLPLVDAARVPVGIFTRQDVIGRVVLARRALDEPIHSVMSTPVITLPDDATAGDAAVLMARRGIRHVVLVDADGALSGVVSERDLFGLKRQSVRELASDIRRAGDVEELVRCAAEIRELSLSLVALGVASGQLTRMISGLNDQLTHRLLDLAAARHDLSGLALCWIGMGSEGRNEQTIATDQDNGLVFASSPDAAGEAGLAPAEAEAIRARLLPFAREVNLALDRCGYPLCKGGVMAMNPRWCASAAEWRAAFFGWIDRGDPESLLAAGIFFDFRPLWGESALAESLRREITARARANPRFLKQLSDNALRTRAPLNWFGGLDARDHPGGVTGFDLKLEGTAPFVDAARVLALAAGVPATATVERLVEAGQAKGIAAREVRAWADAFEHLQLVRLRTQHRRAAGLIPPSDNPNLVPVDDLSGLDRRVLREALRQLRRLQQRLELDYPG